MSKIVVVGSINMDVVIRVPHIPAEGETILARGIGYVGGGKGANQAVAVGRLGGDVSMIGRVGKDDFGKILFDNLQTAGIDTTGVEWDDETSSGTAYINVSDAGENNIVVYAGANGRVDVAQVKRHEALFEQAEYCLIQMEIPFETIRYVVELCRAKGVKLLFNPAPAPASPLPMELLQELYMFIPNETELELLCPGTDSREDKARRLLEAGVRNVIVTLGSQGSMLINGEGVQYFSAIPVKPVDTTAAGDSFIGGLVVAMSEGKDIGQAIQFGALVAGIAVSREGAQSSIPDRDMVEAYGKGN